MFSFAVFVVVLTEFGVVSGHRMYANLDEDVETGRHPPLCDGTIVSETCKYFLGDEEGWTSFQRVHVATSTSSKSVEDLWKKFGLPRKQLMTCQRLCWKVVDYLKELEVLPAASDMGCYRKDSKTVCNLDLSPDALRASANIEGLELPDFHDTSRTVLAGPDYDTIVAERVKEDETDDLQEEQVTHIDISAHNLAHLLARSFRIYPVPGAEFRGIETSNDQKVTQTSNDQKEANSLIESSSGHWQQVIQQRILQAQSYVNTAIREGLSDMRATATWFGNNAYSDEYAREKIQNTLISIDNVLSNAEYVFPGAGCNADVSYQGAGNWGVYAYVTPRKTNAHGEQTMIRGKYAVYLCPDWVNEQQASVQVQTLVHEASHHGVAFTQDVCAYSPNYRVIDTPRVPARSFNPSQLIVGNLIDASNSRGHAVAEIRRVIGNYVDLRIMPGDYVNCPKAYGRNTCQELASNDPLLALANADNFGYYIEDVFSR